MRVHRCSIVPKRTSGLMPVSWSPSQMSMNRSFASCPTSTCTNLVSSIPCGRTWCSVRRSSSRTYRSSSMSTGSTQNPNQSRSAGLGYGRSAQMHSLPGTPRPRRTSRLIWSTKLTKPFWSRHRARIPPRQRDTGSNRFWTVQTLPGSLGSCSVVPTNPKS